MAKGGSKRGAVWEHFTEQEGKTASGKAKKLGRCKHCKETAEGTATRFKTHLNKCSAYFGKDEEPSYGYCASIEF